MKKVSIQYFCDCCKKEITDQVHAIKIGTLGEFGAFVSSSPEEVLHYHEQCMPRLMEKNETKKKIDHGRIVALYTANPPRSLKWIADDVGCSVQTVINHLTKEGIYKSDSNT